MLGFVLISSCTCDALPEQGTRLSLSILSLQRRRSTRNPEQQHQSWKDVRPRASVSVDVCIHFSAPSLPSLEPPSLPRHSLTAALTAHSLPSALTALARSLIISSEPPPRTEPLPSASFRRVIHLLPSYIKGCLGFCRGITGLVSFSLRSGNCLVSHSASKQLTPCSTRRDLVEIGELCW